MTIATRSGLTIIPASLGDGFRNVLIGVSLIICISKCLRTALKIQKIDHKTTGYISHMSLIYSLLVWNPMMTVTQQMPLQQPAQMDHNLRLLILASECLPRPPR